MMTPLRLCGASLLAACALVVAGCGGGTAASGSRRAASAISFQQLAQSASSSAEADDRPLLLRHVDVVPGRRRAVLALGRRGFDTTNERSSFAVDLSSLAKLLGGFVAGFGGAGAKDLPDFDDPAGWKIEVVQDGDVGT